MPIAHSLSNQKFKRDSSKQELSVSASCPYETYSEEDYALTGIIEVVIAFYPVLFWIDPAKSSRWEAVSVVRDFGTDGGVI